MARAFGSPTLPTLYDGENSELPNLPKRKSADDIVWGKYGEEARLLSKFRRLMAG